MRELALFSLKKRNPDVLTCIANLSNDEVFTPPVFAKEMLDTLANSWSETHDGASIWSDSSVTFLDPSTKSGVFLREVVERLVSGLADEIPDIQTRVNHILLNQVFGIGITQLTSLLARRSVYCSKSANGEHSVGRFVFENEDGNIWFEPMQHDWVGGRCKYCGVGQSTLNREDGLETHAYAFIHTDDIKARMAEMFGGNMQFDVIIGNPPYQLNDGGGEGASAIPLYHKFVQQAKALDPRMLTMVIPARWYSGGKGLDEFRAQMLRDGGLSEIHDFPETDMVFPGVNIRGGVCYFLWRSDHVGEVRIVNYKSGSEPDSTKRPLLEEGLSTFVRYNSAISILRKVLNRGEPTMNLWVQPRNPFGIAANFSDFSPVRTSKTPILLFRSRRGSSLDREVYIRASAIQSNLQYLDRLKVLVSKASPGGDEYPHSIFSTPFIAPRNSVSTETYLIVGFPETEQEAKNLVTYMRSRFFRFLVSLVKNTQNISRSCFALVPVQDLSTSWTDEKLYEKYGISDDEIAFIEKMIRPMGAVDE
jgi:site-specific DNA-methyltransferase (adenine-specific)